MGMFFGRTLSASFNIALAAILAPILLVACALALPGLLLHVQDGSDWVYRWLTGLDWPPQYRAALRQWTSAGQFTLVFFLIVARILIAIVLSSFKAAIMPFFRRPEDREPA
jgi:hypothetical protein